MWIWRSKTLRKWLVLTVKLFKTNAKTLKKIAFGDKGPISLCFSQNPRRRRGENFGVLLLVYIYFLVISKIIDFVLVYIYPILRYLIGLDQTIFEVLSIWVQVRYFTATNKVLEIGFEFFSAQNSIFLSGAERNRLSVASIGMTGTGREGERPTQPNETRNTTVLLAAARRECSGSCCSRGTTHSLLGNGHWHC